MRCGSLYYSVFQSRGCISSLCATRRFLQSRRLIPDKLIRLCASCGKPCLIWMAGRTRHVSVLPAGSCGIFLGRWLARRPRLPGRLCMFVRTYGTCTRKNHKDCGSVRHVLKCNFLLQSWTTFVPNLILRREDQSIVGHFSYIDICLTEDDNIDKHAYIQG